MNFESVGHQVLEAEDGEAGLHLAAQERPDLVVLDLMLPYRDGFSVLEELRAIPATRDVPVILLTAKVQVEDQRRAFEAGAVEYVTKPFSPSSLTELVETVHALSPDQRTARRERRLAALGGTSN